MPGVALLLLVGACSAAPHSGPVAQSELDRSSWTCPDPVNAALPLWAGREFIHPRDPVPHLVGAHGAIVAVPFGWPLRDHQPAGHDNKILWVARSGVGPLHIQATEQASAETVARELPHGPGPSLVNMPRAGCWRFEIRWADQHDVVFVRYHGPET